MVNKRLSPLRYPGGKSKILDFIIKLIERNDGTGSDYVEPYAGGAGIALGLLIGGYVSKIHINDLDHAIYSFWNCILNNTSDFINKINSTKVSVSEWEHQRNIYNDPNSFSQLEVGFSAFYLNRCNRSGVLNGGCIGGKKQSGEYKIDARFNKLNLIKRIELIASYKNNIELYNKDTLDLITKNINKFSNAIIYFDPPYYKKGSCLYKNFYTHKDHVKISNTILKLKGHWIVSYDNVPEIIDIYSGVRKKEFNISYSAGTKKKGKEVMFFSQDLIVPRIPIYSC